MLRRKLLGCADQFGGPEFVRRRIDEIARP